VAWSCQKTDNYRKTVEELLPSEQGKVNDWINAITGQNVHPLHAGRVKDDIRKLSDGTYEFYAGSFHRVFFDLHPATEVIELYHVGHTLTKK